jgi:hypothetical protein
VTGWQLAALMKMILPFILRQRYWNFCRPGTIEDKLATLAGLH